MIDLHITPLYNLTFTRHDKSTFLTAFLILWANFLEKVSIEFCRKFVLYSTESVFQMLSKV